MNLYDNKYNDKTMISSTIDAMRYQEETTYVYSDYLQQKQHRPQHHNIMNNVGRNYYCNNGLAEKAPGNYGKSNSRNVIVIDNDCRKKMIDWCYEIVDYCHFQHETIEIAISNLDRYVMTNIGSEALSNRWIYQLSAMTSLYTAIKMYEPQAIDSLTVSKLSRGTYTKQQIETMELQMLKALTWNVNPPTSLEFVRQILALLPTHIIDNTMKETIYDVTKFQIELALQDGSSKFQSTKKSILALTSLINSLESLGIIDFSVNITTTSYGYNIVNYLSKILNIDYHSQEFVIARNYLYSVVMHDDHHDEADSSIHDDSNMPPLSEEQQTKIFNHCSNNHRCSSPRSLTEC